MSRSFTSRGETTTGNFRRKERVAEGENFVISSFLFDEDYGEGSEKEERGENEYACLTFSGATRAPGFNACKYLIFIVRSGRR